MEKINYQKKLITFLIFFSLMTISISFTSDEVDEVDPVIFINDMFKYRGNKSYLFVISNSSFFTTSGSYKFKFDTDSKYNYTVSYFYIYDNIPLKNLSYDYLSSFNIEANSKTKDDSLVMSTTYYYSITFEPKKNFQYLIFKIPVIKHYG